MEKIAVFIVARNSSKRLPGKAMAEIKKQPILQHIVSRINNSELIDEIWFLTSSNKCDDCIEQLGNSINVRVFRGDPEDTLDRIFKASLETKCELIIEIGGDCPFVDDELLSIGINSYKNNPSDLTTNCLLSPFTYPVGYDFIMLRKKALARLNQNAKRQSERHQPFQFIIRNKDMFTINTFTLRSSLNHWRWTLDYEEDLDFITEVYNNFPGKYYEPSFNQIVNLLNEQKELLQLNAKYAEEVKNETIWFTGSFVDEIHEEIKSSLKEAYQQDKQGKWHNAYTNYMNARNYLDELINRTNCFSKK